MDLKLVIIGKCLNWLLKTSFFMFFTFFIEEFNKLNSDFPPPNALVK